MIFYLCPVLFLILSVISSIAIKDNLKIAEVQHVAVLFLASSALLLFLASVGKLKSDWSVLNKKTLILVNITQTLCWASIFLSLSFTQASTFYFYFLGLTPFFAMIFKQSFNRYTTIFIVFFLNVAWLHAENIINESYFWGALFAAIASCCSVISALTSSGFSQLAAHRQVFWRMILTFSGVLLYLFYVNDSILLQLVISPEFILLSMITTTIPVVLFQVGLKKIDAVHCYCIIAFTPLVTYLAEYLQPPHFLQQQTIAALVLLSVINIFLAIKKK